MTDDHGSTGDGRTAETGRGFLPIHLMSEDILQEWSSLPNQTVITVAITKQELDNLFFALANTQNAIDMTNRAFVQWTNGQVPDAQSSLEASRSSVVNGMNALRFFFEAIVSGSVRGGHRG